MLQIIRGHAVCQKIAEVVRFAVGLWRIFTQSESGLILKIQKNKAV